MVSLCLPSFLKRACAPRFSTSWPIRFTEIAYFLPLDYSSMRRCSQRMLCSRSSRMFDNWYSIPTIYAVPTRFSSVSLCYITFPSSRETFSSCAVLSASAIFDIEPSWKTQDCVFLSYYLRSEYFHRSREDRVILRDRSLRLRENICRRWQRKMLNFGDLVSLWLFHIHIYLFVLPFDIRLRTRKIMYRIRSLLKVKKNLSLRRKYYPSCGRYLVSYVMKYEYPFLNCSISLM